jgi:hypothetical protein
MSIGASIGSVKGEGPSVVTGTSSALEEPIVRLSSSIGEKSKTWVGTYISSVRCKIRLASTYIVPGFSNIFQGLKIERHVLCIVR